MFLVVHKCAIKQKNNLKRVRCLNELSKEKISVRLCTNTD